MSEASARERFSCNLTTGLHQSLVTPKPGFHFPTIIREEGQPVQAHTKTNDSLIS